MYNIQIKTKYNTIHISVQDLEDPEVKEILKQPWVEDVKIEKGKPKYIPLLKIGGCNEQIKRKTL